MANIIDQFLDIMIAVRGAGAQLASVAHGEEGVVYLPDDDTIPLTVRYRKTQIKGHVVGVVFKRDL